MSYLCFLFSVDGGVL